MRYHQGQSNLITQSWWDREIEYMKILRAIVAVIIGYVLFATGSILLVGPVMTRQGPFMVVVALAALALIGLVVGCVARAIAGDHRRVAGYILAGLVALATLVNLMMGLGAEPVWYKIGTLVLTVPAILLVGLRGPTQQT